MQGFNMGRYVPPDLEGIASFNQASGKGHALGSRARNISSGILTVRFECPFAIWCTSCPKPTIIGQGVRFNAEKKKVGNYLSTPIYAFKFKHSVCGGIIEIRTDPKNTAYVVTEGAKKRDTGEERVGLREGEIVIGGKSEEEKKRLEGDPFARLEEKAGDKKQASSEKARIEELYARNERDWDDPGEVNRRLRRTFRAERKVRHRRVEATEALQERMGIGLELLEETEEDNRRAGFVDFGEAGGDEAQMARKAQTKPLFGNGEAKHSSQHLKGTKSIQHQKEKLRNQLNTNTRAVLDPFLGERPEIAKDPPLLIKRKREHLAEQNEPPEAKVNKGTDSVPLVDYDSD